MKKISLALLISILYLVSGAIGAEGWETNFEAAKKKAVAENKALLVDFTGSDWCGWCIRLQKEVFSQADFAKYAQDKFVLVELDYPQKTAQDPALKKQNEQLAQKYQVQGFPTILLMDAQGRPFAKTGYQAGGPSAYNKHLDELLKVRTKRDAAFSAAEKVKGPEKAASLVAALKTLPEEVIGHYGDVMDQISKLDPQDTTGFKKTQGLKLSIKNLTGQVAQLANQGKAADAEKLVDDFVKENALAGEQKQQALLAKINCYNPQEPGALEKADALMDVIIALGADTQAGQQCAAIKARIVQMKAQMKTQAK
jgi:thiol-disulfide isomerase/thioredoxin